MPVAPGSGYPITINPPAPPSGQGFAPGLNPLGLFSLKTQGDSTVYSGNQYYNPGDVPAPPQYGTGQGAPTNFTQDNFGGQVAPDMQAQLNNVHSFVLAPATPPPPATKPPVTQPPKLRLPFNPYNPVASPTLPQRGLPGDPLDTTRAPFASYDPELSDAQLFRGMDGFLKRLHWPIGASGPDAANAAATVPNTALSTASMRVPETPLSFGGTRASGGGGSFGGYGRMSGTRRREAF